MSPEEIRLPTLAAIAAANDADTLERIRIEVLGKAGSVTMLLKGLGRMPAEERLQQAPLLQALRAEIATALQEKKYGLARAALEERLLAEHQDLSLPALDRPAGTIHPISQVMDELAEIFADLGFAVAEGPEIEDDWHNFTALNIPPEHPARAMHDTFYLEREVDGAPLVLRTHTSPVQVRTMLGQKPPIRIIAPGRVYRADSDATHTPMFHQVEGLVIDRGIHLGHLKWTLETFVRAFFEVDDVVLRLRPSFFPFTEPSVEVDVGCSFDKGVLKIGGAAHWLEILGAGMVHEKVLRNCDLDPKEWQGFAFGCGIDRLAMLKYGMTDLRAFFDADLRWLKHYGFAAAAVPTLAAGVGA